MHIGCVLGGGFVRLYADGALVSEDAHDEPVATGDENPFAIGDDSP